MTTEIQPWADQGLNHLPMWQSVWTCSYLTKNSISSTPYSAFLSRPPSVRPCARRLSRPCLRTSAAQGSSRPGRHHRPKATCNFPLGGHQLHNPACLIFLTHTNLLINLLTITLGLKQPFQFFLRRQCLEQIRINFVRSLVGRNAHRLTEILHNVFNIRTVD